LPSTTLRQAQGPAQAADLREPLAELAEAIPLNLTTLIPFSEIRKQLNLQYILEYGL